MATIKLQVPAELSSITIKQYQDFDKILKANEGAEESEFVNMKMISIFCKCSMDDLRKGSIEQYNAAIEILTETFKQQPAHQKVITVDGVEYGFIPNLDEITLGEYVDLDKYIREPQDYHRAMAVMYRPITEKIRDTYSIEDYQGSEKYADVMKLAGLDSVMGAMVFFYHLADELLKATRDSLEGDLLMSPQVDGLDSALSGDGISPSHILQAITSFDYLRSLNYRYSHASLN